MFRDAQITATAAERFANPLLNTAESPEMVSDDLTSNTLFITNCLWSATRIDICCQVNQLLANMLDGRPEESAIVNGVEVTSLNILNCALKFANSYLLGVDGLVRD